MFPAMASGPGLKPPRAFWGDCGAEFPEPLLKRKRSGSVQTLSIFLNIVLILQFKPVWNGPEVLTKTSVFVRWGR